MRSSTAIGGVRIQVRTGVNTGEVVAGAAVGEFLVTGDPVNVAARLEQSAAQGEILIGGSTYRLLKNAVTVEEAGQLKLKGKARPVEAWRLLGVVPEAYGVARRLASPLAHDEQQVRRAMEENSP